ncbi:30S ribosomal protein S30 [Candidatus Tenderia electrophaga]|jgi:ribosomal subunit interface protein|uniref:30S ribosomal protein S30 n=1 Tax=Candidatus Tenderia electrophaga TaxID=1748243 RepID=A0A0S2THD5_9GAMM|nr:30S ribosomal protein S30 [Candidatus Tenderia electrophaga]
MQLPLQITFRHMEKSEAMEAAIRKRAEQLDQFHDKIMSCRVVVEPKHQNKHKGNLFQIRIDLTTPPSKELVVSRESDLHQAHEDAYVAVRDAFDAMRRQLEAHHRRQKGKVKTHEVPPHGRVSQLVPEEDYGRIETPLGRDIYFHRNSLVNGEFDKLEIGTEVRFNEEDGEMGPKATSVSLIGKHHIVG